MVNRGRIKKTIATTLSCYGPAEAIWVVENEAMKAGEKTSASVEVHKIADQVISDLDIVHALSTSRDFINRLNRMMPHATKMEPEEWVLAITIFSNLYSIHMFASRRGISVQESSLSNVIELFRKHTSDFQDSNFKRALATARSYNFNPLPSFI